MKIVVDTNIVFSALINPKSTISDLILNSSESFTFYSPTTILSELKKHQKKLLKISGLSEDELEELKSYLWTGDKKLKKGVASQRFNSILETKEI